MTIYAQEEMESAQSATHMKHVEAAYWTQTGTNG